MADQNKLKLILGLSLILVSFLCAVVTFYFIGNSQKKKAEKISSLEVQLTNLIAEKAEGEMRSFDYRRLKRGPINLEDVLSKADIIYGPAELNRKEGVFWVDRKTSTFMVTLGMVNGLITGSSIAIFDGDKKIAEVSVEVPLDIVSYVKPVGKSLDQFDKDYYRAVAE